jgi:spore germination protein YaaH
MIGAAMVARNRARYLAPIALAATITATYMVVHAGLGHKHSTTTTTSQIVRHPGGRRHRPGTRKTYVVQNGDTLSTISAKVGVPVATIESLNPNVNPNALQTGQRLRLRR